MTFRKFGKTALTAALSLAIAFSLTSCIRSFTVGYLYVTGTVTTSPSGNGIITGFKINNDNGKLTPINGTPVASGGANPVGNTVFASCFCRCCVEKNQGGESEEIHPGSSR